MLGHLGIQKRFIAYVAVGLVIMFGMFFYLGMRAVDESIDQVFEERLAIAESVATTMRRDFDHVIRDAIEGTRGLAPGMNGEDLRVSIQDVFAHIANVDAYAFFTVTSVWLLDAEGKPVTTVPAQSMTLEPDELSLFFSEASAANPGPRVFWPSDGLPGRFCSVGIPQEDTQGNVWAWLVVNTRGASSARPFVPFGSRDPGPDGLSGEATEYPEQSQYHLEVLAPSGISILGIGPDEAQYVGQVSWHYPLVKSLMATGKSDVLLHDVKGSTRAGNHVMAVVPIPPSDTYLVLEQGRDVALAVPNKFRNRLILFGSLGFVAYLSVAWVTTRHVVKPTEQLTAAAVRMAGGHLSTQIRVKARDEIGELAESLEIMRRQLKNALEEVETTNRELEGRVKERTRQLQDLVGRVLTAQEEERRRIALELHDETAQALTALTFMLDGIVRHRERLAPDDAAMLQEARGVASQMLEGLRRLIYALRPVELEDVGLAAALRWYADDHLERLGVAIHVASKGAEIRLPDHLEVVLYRIGQEALNNVARHSKASNVWINIAYRKPRMSLTVRDDGVGFDQHSVTRATPPGSGIGLEGMRERATFVGGQLTIETTLGTGTTVRVEVPIPPDD